MGWPLYATILVLFACWFSVHVLLCWSLGVETWWRGLVALVVPPLAPWWGQSKRRGRLAAVWVAAGAAYVLALTVGLL